MIHYLKINKSNIKLRKNKINWSTKLYTIAETKVSVFYMFLMILQNVCIADLILSTDVWVWGLCNHQEKKMKRIENQVEWNICQNIAMNCKVIEDWMFAGVNPMVYD